jgi:hypothetical protein
MLFHTVIVHLFRPMLKVDLLHSDLIPRDICIEAANRVSEIVRLYRRFYDFRVAHLAIPHILLSITIVHLLYSTENRTSYQNLLEGLQGLEDLHECHYFGARSYRIIHTLARTWNFPWPEELQNAKLVPKTNPNRSQGTISPSADPLMFPPNTVTTSSGRTGPNMLYQPIHNPNRRESLSMFAGQGSLQLATHLAKSRPGSVPISQHHHSPIVGQSQTQPFSNNLSMPQYQYSQSIAAATMNASAAISSSITDPAETIFWNPIPGMPGPILPRNKYPHIGPMGLDSVLQPSDMGDRLGRDGFKMSEEWQASHSGFATVQDHGFTAQNSQSDGAYLHRNTTSYVQPDDVSVGEGYSQPPQRHHGHVGEGQEEYDGAWYSGQMD